MIFTVIQTIWKYKIRFGQASYTKKSEWENWENNTLILMLEHAFIVFGHGYGSKWKKRIATDLKADSDSYSNWPNMI